MTFVTVSFFISGGALCFLSLLPLLVSNVRIHLGIWLPLLLGVLFLVYGRRYHAWFQDLADEMGLAAFCVLCLFWAWLLGSVLVLARGYPRFREEEESSPHTVIVPGCSVRAGKPSKMLGRRLEAALSLLRAHPDWPCIVSGGQGSDENCAESAVMKAWLNERGVEEARVWEESRSRNTWQNLSLSKVILEKQGLPANVVIVSDAYHLYRCARFCARLSLSVSCKGCPINPLVAFGYWFRECAALLLSPFTKGYRGGRK